MSGMTSISGSEAFCVALQAGLCWVNSVSPGRKKPTVGSLQLCACVHCWVSHTDHVVQYLMVLSTNNFCCPWFRNLVKPKRSSVWDRASVGQPWVGASTPPQSTPHASQWSGDTLCNWKCIEVMPHFWASQFSAQHLTMHLSFISGGFIQFIYGGEQRFKELLHTGCEYSSIREWCRISIRPSSRYTTTLQLLPVFTRMLCSFLNATSLQILSHRWSYLLYQRQTVPDNHSCSSEMYY